MTVDKTYSFTEPVTDDEDVTHTTLELVRILNININKNDISIAHRLPLKKRLGRTRTSTSEAKHPQIIVRFVSRYKRNQIYASRFKSKEIEEFPIETMDRLYKNENLTQKRKQLFWLTK